jgi:serine/threonine-protein kinase
VSLKKLGRYDLVRVLGKGAMGIVYEGRDPNLDRRVAIKTVKVENLSEEAAAEYEARFRTEARSAARLQHPNIVSVYDSDRDGDIAFLVMEYIQGDDLKHHLDKGVRYSLEQSLKMIRDLLSALDYAHKQGIVHRDIKPANLLIEPGGRVKLTDFGVARIQDSGEATRTQGSMVGTLKYMSPEQVQGQKIDARADLFSVGVVLYQLLTDKRPFDGDNDFSIIHQIIGHTPAAPSSFNARLPSAIDAVVARALAKNRDERFGTARDFAAALQSAIRRAEDQTVVPPADPSKKSEAAGSGSRAGHSVPGLATGGTVGGATSATGSSATVTQELELVYWKDIKDSTDPEELHGFLARFPEGIYADLARRRLRRLSGGTSGDQTLLNGVSAAAAVADQDLEATRMLSAEASRVPVSRPPEPALPSEASAPLPTSPPAEPAAAAEDLTRTLVEPREAEPAVVEEGAPATAAVVAAASPARPASAPPPATQSRRLAVMLASAAVVVVAGVTAFTFMGRGDAPAGQPALASAASASADAAPVAALAVATTAPAAAVPVAAVAASAAASRPAAAASAARPRASAPTRAPQRPASAAAAPVQEAPAPAAQVQERKEEARTPVAAAAEPRLVPPSETCKDRVFLSKQFCLQAECAKPAYQRFPACVRLREEARLREDSKIGN